MLFSAAPAVETMPDAVPGELNSEFLTPPVRELAFVDSGIEDYQDLVDDLRQHHTAELDVVVISADRDGVEQIQQAVSRLSNLDTIHIFSHGTPGSIQLGSSHLTVASMDGIHRESLHAMGAALADKGDILIYGCHFGADDVGQAALQKLAARTGADVAASHDLTGRTGDSSDWQLEVAQGTIESQVAVSAEFQADSLVVLGPIAQEFYVPISEAGIYEANEKILNEGAFGAVSTDTITVVGITINQDGTEIVYDHHEDNYESDLENPIQGTSEIWGDGNLANGVAPGFASDLLSAGDIILLQNTIDTTATPDVTFDFDGGDRFGADRGVAVTRAGWSDYPGPVLAGTVEVADTSRWGTDYLSPAGQDTTIGTLYEYVGLFVQAQQDNTNVAIDTNADGSTDLAFTLQQGEIRHIDGGILQGASITADQRVQVDLITGDRDSGVDSRWYMLRPSSTWSSSYVGPAASTVAGEQSSLVLYNPHATALDVDIETLSGTTTVTVPGAGTFVHTLPFSATSSGQFVSSQDSRDFYVVFAMDTDATHTTFDWGFSLLPADALTEAAFAGWAPGSLGLTGNGSPVWVTANHATTLYVDYDGDPSTGAQTDPFGNQYDQQVAIARLQSVQLYDTVNGDNDQSGLRVYTIDGTDIASAWGIDPGTAGPGNPFLDMGTVVLPSPVPDVEKNVAITTDVNGNGLADPGDTVTWTISISNLDVNPMINVLAFDDLPANTTYVANSTIVAGVAYPDDIGGRNLVALR